MSLSPTGSHPHYIQIVLVEDQAECSSFLIYGAFMDTHLFVSRGPTYTYLLSLVHHLDFSDHNLILHNGYVTYACNARILSLSKARLYSHHGRVQFGYWIMQNIAVCITVCRCQ